MTQGLSYITKEGSDSLNRVPEGRWRPPLAHNEKSSIACCGCPPLAGVYIPCGGVGGAASLSCFSVRTGGWPEAALQADRPLGRCMRSGEEEVIGADDIRQMVDDEL